MNLSDPIFIDQDLATVIQETVAYYEAQTGKTLQPAQVERLLLNAFSYREGILRAAIQDAGMQNLVRFARFPILDYLGEIVGVERLPEQNAQTTVRFNFIAGHGDVVIPAGTRIATSDGALVFETMESYNIVDADTFQDAIIEATTPGKNGNGYLPGTISRLMDPQPFIATVANITESVGGSDMETDDQLRVRIPMACEGFTTAGSKGAYIYHTKSVSPSIIDVTITNPTPGVVVIYPLMDNGETTPPEVLTAVLLACSGEKVRPMNDTVMAESPTPVSYTLDIDLVIFTGQAQQTIEAQVTAAIAALVKEKQGQLGQDLTKAQIIAAAMVPGVFDVMVTGFTNLTITDTQFAVCTLFTVNTYSTTNG